MDRSEAAVAPATFTCAQSTAGTPGSSAATSSRRWSVMRASMARLICSRVSPRVSWRAMNWPMRTHGRATTWMSPAAVGMRRVSIV